MNWSGSRNVSGTSTSRASQWVVPHRYNSLPNRRAVPAITGTCKRYRVTMKTRQVSPTADIRFRTK